MYSKWQYLCLGLLDTIPKWRNVDFWTKAQIFIMDERTQKYRIKSLSNEGDNEPQILHHDTGVSIPYNAQYVLLGFEVPFIYLLLFSGETFVSCKKK